MADSERIVRVTLKADTSQYVAAMNAARRATWWTRWADYIGILLAGVSIGVIITAFVASQTLAT